MGSINELLNISCSPKLISFIRETFGKRDVTVSVRKPPMYITHFLPDEENRDIILIYENVNSLDFGPGKQSSSFEKSPDQDGNPLEAPFVDDTVLDVTISLNKLDVNKEINKHFPLDVPSARYCLSLCNTRIQPKLPVWIFTDGEDLNKTVLMSSESDETFSRRCYASQSNFDDDNVSIEQLLKKHQNLSLIRTPPHPKCNVSCTYYKSLTMCENSDGLLYSTTLIKMLWDKLTFDPPLKSNSLNIQVMTRCRIGHGSGGLAFFWNELLLLRTVLNMIKENQSYQFAAKFEPFRIIIQDLKSNLKNEPEIIKSNIQQLFVPNISLISQKSDGIKSISNNLSSFMSIAKEHLDPTDKLWHLFLGCKNMEEISSYIKQVFELTRNNSFLVGIGNITKMAAVLIGKSNGIISDPLEYFVEIGIEKLRKEVISIFSDARIASLFALNVPKFPKFTNVKTFEWIGIAEGWMIWISKVYSALELLINTQEALSLRNEDMESHACKLLENITGPNSCVKGIDWILENEYQEIKWSLKPQIVEKHINTKPDVWTLILESSSNENHQYKSIFKKSNQCPFPKHMVPELNNLDTTTNINQNFSIFEQSSNNFTILCEQEKCLFWSEMHVVSNKLI